MQKYRLNEITQNIEIKLKEKKFDLVNNMLKGLDINNEELRLLMIYLISTVSYNKELPYREEFYQKVSERAKSCGQYEKNWFKALGR